MSKQAQTSTQIESNQTTVSELLTALVEMSSTQAQQTREMSRNLKRLVVEVEKERKKMAKTCKPKRTVKQKPVQVDSQMAKFLKHQKVDQLDGGWTRQLMMKAVSAYIKEKELQLAENKKNWKPDDTLVKLFKLDASETYTFMNINGLLTRVINKK
jgi:chromatin remodeling complex protein RSC6